ncbi:MAG: hypothetical protein GY710_13965 [Desulfobacteraceae bacterium]|nr:hypothetical protein [Desulfobacteraceae bacterium]
MLKQLIVLSILFFGTAGVLFADQSGALAPLTFSGPKEAGPFHYSKSYVLEKTVTAGEADLDLMIDTPTGAIAVVMGEQDIRAQTQEKKMDGISYFDSDLEIMDLPGMGTRFNLDKMKPGKFNMKISNAKRQFVSMIVVQPESPLVLKARLTPLAAKVGEPITVEAQLNDEDKIFHKDIQIRAKLATGHNFKLRDDGKKADKIAGDGVFSGKFTTPKVKGLQNIKVHLKAEGKRGSSANDFHRTCIISVMVTAQTSRFPYDIQVNNTGILVPVQAAQGRYRLSVIYGAQGKKIAWAQKDFTLTGQDKKIQVNHPRQALGADQAVIRLLNYNTRGLEDEQLVEFHPPGGIKYRSNYQPTLKTLPESKQNSLLNLE